MTERENVLLVYNHKKPQWTPIWMEAIHVAGWASNERATLGPKINDRVSLDSFGCQWDVSHGASCPVAGNFILEDICDWREVVKFPEPKKWNWEQIYQMEMGSYDGTKAVVYFCEEGLFDRLTALMGFENALISLVTEPEECYAFFSRLADYKVELIECAAKYIKPDVVMYTDDLAKMDGLFMSPETYRELIKPHHARIIQAIKDNGMIPEQHTCGKFVDILDDYVEMGVESLYPIQPSNDIEAIQKKYGDRVVINGGFDSQGPAGRDDASEETIREEARRMANTYAVNGGYICLPLIGNGQFVTPEQGIRMGWFIEEFRKTCNALGI